MSASQTPEFDWFRFGVRFFFGALLGLLIGFGLWIRFDVGSTGWLLVIGSVVIRVQPLDAEILIDGERWTLGAGDERLVVQLSTGRHHLDIRKREYRSVTLDLDVLQGETVPVNVSLTKE